MNRSTVLLEVEFTPVQEFKLDDKRGWSVPGYPRTLEYLKMSRRSHWITIDNSELDWRETRALFTP